MDGPPLPHSALAERGQLYQWKAPCWLAWILRRFHDPIRWISQAKDMTISTWHAQHYAPLAGRNVCDFRQSISGWPPNFQTQRDIKCKLSEESWKEWTLAARLLRFGVRFPNLLILKLQKGRCSILGSPWIWHHLILLPKQIHRNRILLRILLMSFEML